LLRKSTEDQAVMYGVGVIWTSTMAAIGILSVGAAWAGPATEVQIPEPGSLALMAVGVGAIAIFRARSGK